MMKNCTCVKVFNQIDLQHISKKFPHSGVKLRKCYDGTISKVKSNIKVDHLKALQNIDRVTYNLKISDIYQISPSFLW